MVKCTIPHSLYKIVKFVKVFKFKNLLNRLYFVYIVKIYVIGSISMKIIAVLKVEVKVNQSHYRPGGVQSVPGSLGSQIP